MHYSLAIGQVQWDLSPGAEYYTVQGDTQQGLAASCTTNDTYCAMYNMVCGQMYTISVTAHNHVCQGVSTSNNSVTVITGKKTTYNLEIIISFAFSCKD